MTAGGGVEEGSVRICIGKDVLGGPIMPVTGLVCLLQLCVS
jgi:hypothetical protein